MCAVHPEAPCRAVALVQQRARIQEFEVCVGHVPLSEIDLALQDQLADAVTHGL